MPGSEQPSKPQDSVEAELPRWIADMPDVDPLTEAARQRIGRMARLFERLLTQVAADNELTAGDWAALSALQRSGPPYQASPTTLSQQLGITSGTMSVRLARLSQAGLIEIRRCGRRPQQTRPAHLSRPGPLACRHAATHRPGAPTVRRGPLP
nr:MarR family transcriptional regulator [Streptomyces sp. RLB1-33]